VLDTGNPYLAAIDPAAALVGGSVTLAFTGEGFEDGAVARFQGAGLDVEQPLSVASATSATLASPLDLSAASVGEVEVHVLNPGRLISNRARLTLSAGFSVYEVVPAGGRQDQATAATVRGAGFAAGLAITLRSASGATSTLLATVTSPTEATVTVPKDLALGVYEVTAANPGGPASSPAHFQVNEGRPVLAQLSPATGASGATFTGIATGQYFYPSSSVHVFGGGLAETPVPTTWNPARPGELSVTVTLPAAGAYSVKVVNPGNPTPLESDPLPFTVQ
jgi:hypothetical protein